MHSHQFLSCSNRKLVEYLHRYEKAFQVPQIQIQTAAFPVTLGCLNRIYYFVSDAAWKLIIDFPLILTFSILIIFSVSPSMPPSPCPCALSLACTNPFVVDWGAQALAELSALEELVQTRGAHKPSCPPLDQAHLFMPLTSLIFKKPSLFLFTLNQTLSPFACLGFLSIVSLLSQVLSQYWELEEVGQPWQEHALQEQCFHLASAVSTWERTGGKRAEVGVHAGCSHSLGSAPGYWQRATAPKEPHRCTDLQAPPGGALCRTNWHISGHLWQGNAYEFNATIQESLHDHFSNFISILYAGYLFMYPSHSCLLIPRNVLRARMWVNVKA